MSKKISLSEAFKNGFTTYVDNVNFFLPVSGIVFLILLLPALLELFLFFSFMFSSNIFTKSMPLPFLFISLKLLFFLIFLPLRELYIYQLLRFSILIHEGQNPLWRSFFTLPPRNFISFFLARIVYTIKIILGLIALIVPGIMIAVNYFFAGYTIAHFLTDSLEEDASVSYRITNGNRWSVFFLLLIGNCFFGFLYTFILPIEILITLHVYKQLV